MKIIKQIIRIVLSVILAFLALIPLASLFDHMNWSMFNSWALVHGSFLIAVPILAVLIYLLLGLIPFLRWQGKI